METFLIETSYALIIAQFIIFLAIGLWLYATTDIIKSTFENNDKIIWLLIVTLLPILGTLLYSFIGKKRKLKTL
ncbi:MAG: PLDc_N domain-containing protein [Bizionia sp.]|nr:PLDc_N domain-containing protein [Bizionia sp.]